MMSAYPATSSGMLGDSVHLYDAQAHLVANASRRSSLSSGSVHSRGSEASDKIYEHAHASQPMRAVPLHNLGINTAAAAQTSSHRVPPSPTTPHAHGHSSSHRRDKHRTREEEREANARAAKVERVRRTLGDDVPTELIVPPGTDLSSKPRSQHRRSKTVSNGMPMPSNASYYHPTNALRPPLPGIFEAPLPSEIDRNRSKRADRDEEEALLKSKRRSDKDKGMHTAIAFSPVGFKC